MVHFVPTGVPLLEFGEDGPQVPAAFGESIGAVLGSGFDGDEVGCPEFVESLGEEAVRETGDGGGDVGEAFPVGEEGPQNARRPAAILRILFLLLERTVGVVGKIDGFVCHRSPRRMSGRCCHGSRQTIVLLPILTKL